MAADSLLNIKAMAFNVRYPAPADKGNDSWDVRKSLVVQVIKKYRPDFLGTQEMVAPYVPYLNEQLPEYANFGRYRLSHHDTTYDESARIFYLKDRWEPVVGDSGTFWLSPTPEKPGSTGWTSVPRIVTWARFREKATGFTIYLYNTHWDNAGAKFPAWGWDSSSVLSARRIAGRKVKTDPVIYMGDFNRNQTTNPIKYLLGQNVYPTPPPFAMVDTDPGTIKIDNIFILPNSAKVKSAGFVRDRFTVDGTPNVRPSDHDPVFADLDFPAPPVLALNPKAVTTPGAKLFARYSTGGLSISYQIPTRIWSPGWRLEILTTDGARVGSTRLPRPSSTVNWSEVELAGAAKRNGILHLRLTDGHEFSQTITATLK